MGRRCRRIDAVGPHARPAPAWAAWHQASARAAAQPQSLHCIVRPGAHLRVLLHSLNGRSCRLQRRACGTACTGMLLLPPVPAVAAAMVDEHDGAVAKRGSKQGQNTKSKKNIRCTSNMHASGRCSLTGPLTRPPGGERFRGRAGQVPRARAARAGFDVSVQPAGQPAGGGGARPPAAAPGRAGGRRGGRAALSPKHGAREGHTNSTPRARAPDGWDGAPPRTARHLRRGGQPIGGAWVVCSGTQGRPSRAGASPGLKCGP